MHRRFILNLGLALSLAGLLLSTLLAITRAAAVTRPDNVASQVWDATADGSETGFLVILAEQATLGPAATLPTREARLRYVYDTLRETALRSQAPLRAELGAAGVGYRPFYAVNMLAVEGDRTLVTRLAARSDVARIAANPRVHQPLPEPQPGGVRPMAPQEVEWGVRRINADDVWALGYTGQGIVVAGQDTGYDWDHPALINQYRGYGGTITNTTHDYNWHDAIHSGDSSCGADSPFPCDDHGHGTHTMGSIVGDDGVGNQIGVAPGARWIGCRNMDQGVGTPATYIECFEFFLAPYPVGGDPFTAGIPSLAPHVINNSWTCPPSEGCDWDTLQTVVENVRAAGIVVVASAGNSRPECETIQGPPAIYDAAFSVGATGSSDSIASFSSRGPVTVDGSGRLKPDVSAPGVSIRSSRNGGGYYPNQGTSMAGPHVAGTVALLWSAAPVFIGDVDTTEWIITQTARPRTTTQTCGDDASGDVPNNVYGWGIVDALAALQENARLEVTKQAYPDRVLPGAQLTYTIRVTNTGEITLTPTITDKLPIHITSGETPGGVAFVPGGTLTWTPTILAPGGVWTETVVVTVAVGYVGPLTNVVQVTTEEGGTGVYTATTLSPGLEISKETASDLVLPGSQLVYTISITNTFDFTLTQVVLTDMVPVSTTFAWASGNYTRAGGGSGELPRTVVTWTAASLASQEMLTATLVVTVGSLPPGARVVNDVYGARANELGAPVMGSPVEVIFPWRCVFPLILRDWPSGEHGFQDSDG
ncbi:MAG: S8 family serine peptidase [Chloroflexota bacterium]|nr:S8 family serine peptidase [Chloroflexota bacterium]